MPKRKPSGRSPGKGKGSAPEEPSDSLEFEDAFEDEIEDEAEALAAARAAMEAEEREEELGGGASSAEALAAAAADGEGPLRQLFRPALDKLGEGETLEHDSSAYLMLHRLRFAWPCLSFDFLRDASGHGRTKFPLESYLVAGTQADSAANNQLIVMRLSELHRTKNDGDDGDDDDDDDDHLDDDPVLEHRSLRHAGGVNRVRSMPQHPEVVATWADTGRVHLWNVGPQLRSLSSGGSGAGAAAASEGAAARPFFTFSGHKEEGFALDWSSVQVGRLASGDCKSDIYVWEVRTDGSAAVDGTPFSGHDGSVEDVAWSPNEATVMASCSVDGSVRIWDVRQKKGSMLSVAAHDTDVNVISWSRSVSYLLASGADDGSFKVWDLRNFKADSQVGHFRWHSEPVTSIQWHPTDESVIAVASDDHQVSVWDLALEDDPEHASATPGLSNTVLGSDGKPMQIPPPAPLPAPGPAPSERDPLPPTNSRSDRQHGG